jgi:hypothetical protein
VRFCLKEASEGGETEQQDSTEEVIAAHFVSGSFLFRGGEAALRARGGKIPVQITRFAAATQRIPSHRCHRGFIERRQWQRRLYGRKRAP